MTRTLTADTVVHYGDDGIVLMRRAYPPFESYWALPGGHIESGETASQAAIRETKEETGFDIVLDRGIGNRVLSNDVIFGFRGQFIAAAFEGRVVGGSLKSSHEGIAKVFMIDELPKLMAFDHRKVLRAAGFRI